MSPENQHFLVHYFKGFEPGDVSNFDTVRDFILQRSRQDLPLSEKIHALWYVDFPFFRFSDGSLHNIRLCIETPTTGGCVFEIGDKMLLKFTHMNRSAFWASYLSLIDW